MRLQYSCFGTASEKEQSCTVILLNFASNTVHVPRIAKSTQCITKHMIHILCLVTCLLNEVYMCKKHFHIYTSTTFATTPSGFFQISIFTDCCMYNFTFRITLVPKDVEFAIFELDRIALQRCTYNSVTLTW